MFDSASSGRTSIEHVSSLGDSEVHIWLIPLDIPDEHRSELESFLEDGERERSACYVQKAQRDRFCAGRGFLRVLLGAYTGRSPDLVCFTYGQYGKPALADGPALAFNLSHSGEWGLFGVTRAPAIGVDLEAIRNLTEVDDIARAHFASSEVEELDRLPTGRRQDGFFACWTRKEAYLKMVGDGLAMALDRFEVSVDPEGPAVLRSVNGSTVPARGCAMWSFKPVPGYWAAVAAQGSGLILRQFRLDLFSGSE